ncbi:MAG: right-handed parallel beta-helix repeat-containing protein [Lamprobacter sp.]|uniref:right-handed parallel beta-helix repeat-containing protein n=1 Tax=Lamprobacter sp. TaxID=3100796 RepID=UPI002B25F8C4|nr:right-handed parallel beta-helix repeat-containing protein [Lamprobacter sp.]MEA3639830.1 right-handed parallel beta-helix repeat-containing protein [Lamprobacter sp.]
MMLLPLLWMLCGITQPAFGDRLIEAGPNDYRESLRQLGPGDHLRLASGIYQRGLLLRGTAGAPGRPVIIEGPAEGPPALFEGRDRGITVSLIDVAHVIIRNLYLDGRGARGHAIVAEGRGRFAHDVTLENLTITGFDAAQAFNGISTKTPAWNWVIRDNQIQGVGTGMYLGNSDGTAPFINGLIEGNRIEDTLGYNLQIKHQAPRPVLDGMPQGPSVTVIRDNVFSKLTGGGEGERARPNVLVGHFPLEGAGAEDHYLIERNLFFQNPTERLFQGEGRLALSDNLFVNWFGAGVIFMAHNDVPRVVDVIHNTILTEGPALTVTGMPEGLSPQVAGNVLLSASPQLEWDDDLNVVGELAEAEAMFVAPLAGLDALDLSPREGRLQMPDTFDIESRWPRSGPLRSDQADSIEARFGAFAH